MTNDQGCPGPRGRRRDATIDERILSAARRQLARVGYQALSLSAVAQEACTTRQALYRRWPDKATLATDAMCATGELEAACLSDDPRSDLAGALAEYQLVASSAAHASLAGTMLQEATDAASRVQYGRMVVAPRLGRIRVILERARDLGLVDAEADLEVAMTLPTGALYESQLAGLPIPDDWARRAAALLWRAIGGAE